MMPPTPETGLDTVREGAPACPLCDELHARGDDDCPAARIGTVVADKYLVDRLIGAGGIGAVYGALHLKLQRRVALKMLLKRYADDLEIGRRFVREARQQAALGHPGVVAIHDAGKDPRWGYFFEMEALEGATIFELLRRDGPLAIERAVRLTIETLDVLSAMHDRGIVHRDIKSLNVFVVSDPSGDRVKVIDFGMIKVDDGHALTFTGEILGTLLYMSPEQLTDPRGVDGRSDVYAVAIMLYEMLTGEWPVEYATDSELRKKILHGRLQRHPAAVRPEVPEWLDAVVSKAMQHDRDHRFADARAMQQALAGGLEQRSAPRSWLDRLLRRG